MTTKTSNAVRFFHNGLKVGTGKLVRAHFAYAETEWSVPARSWVPSPHVTIYFRDYADLPAEIRELGAVENNTDLMTDYFEKDRIVLRPSSPRYLDALRMVVAGAERAAKRRQTADTASDLAKAERVYAEAFSEKVAAVVEVLS